MDCEETRASEAKICPCCGKLQPIEMFKTTVVISKSGDMRTTCIDCRLKTMEEYNG